MAETQDATAPNKAPIDEKASVSELRQASQDLKARIAEARNRNDMPLDSALGKPKWEQDAADGHLDVVDGDGDD